MQTPSRWTRRKFIAASALTGAALAAGTPPLPGQNAVKSRFKIIGFSKAFQHLNFEETADAVAQVGWDGIECPVRPKGHIDPERAPDELPRLVEVLNRRGKELSIMTTGITSASQHGAEKLLRLAAQLGIKRYRLGFINYTKEKSIPEQLKEIAAQLRDLAALNKELRLQAGFQNHSGRNLVGAPIWDIWTMIRDVDPHYLGICFDIGHATIEGGESWPTQARLMQRYLTAVYVKDFVWKKADEGWRSQWVPLGEGMVDPSFFKWLKTTDYAGPISQHQEYPIGQGQPMIANMRKDLHVLEQWLTI